MKSKARNCAFMVGLAGLLMSVCTSSAATADVYVVIDKTFEVTVHGAHVEELGKDWYQVVAFHKAIKVKDRAYACVGYLGNVPTKEFLRKSKLLSGDNVVKANLSGANWLVNEPKVVAERKRLNFPLLGAIAAPADISLVTGSKIKCHKGVKWQDNFTSRPSNIEIPDKVWVSQ